MYPSTETKLRPSPLNESLPISGYRIIIGYLKKEARKQSKFYRQKHQDNKLVAIRFDPASLDSRSGIHLVKYLVESEQHGDKIFVQRPNEKLRKVSFVRVFSQDLFH